MTNRERITVFDCVKLGLAVWRQALGERYPSRLLEYFFAYWMMTWSLSTLMPGDMLVGPTFLYLIAFAPEWFWGAAGVITGMVWTYSLLRNGGWAPSPLMRMFCSFLCAMWFWVLFILYTAAVNEGAPDFPNRKVYLIGLLFAGYCVWRNGQDYAEVLARRKLEMQQRDINPATGVPGNAT